MSFDPLNNPRERRAGLLGQRFERASDDTPWHEPDIRVVDAAPGSGAKAEEPAAVQPIWDVEPTGRDWSPGIRLASVAPDEHAQVLWSISQPSARQAEPGILGQNLAAALYPLQPALSPWKHLFQRTASQKRTPEVLALEIAGTQEQIRFLLRGSQALATRVFDHLLLSYGKVKREVVDTATSPELDPLTVQSGEAISFAELYLEHPSVIPLKTSGMGQGIDPLLGVHYACSRAIAESPVPLRVVSQLLITQAPTGWSKSYQNILQRARARRASQPGTKSGGETQQLVLALLLLSAMIALFLVTHGLLFLFWGVLLPFLVLGGSFALARMGRRLLLGLRMLRHESEVATKLAQPLAQTCLRLLVLGPADAPGVREAALDRLIAAYGAYRGGNGWKVGQRYQLGGAILAHPGLTSSGASAGIAGEAFQGSGNTYRSIRNLRLAFQPSSFGQRLLLWLAGDQVRPILSMQEITALWHLLAPSQSIPSTQDRGPM